MREDCFLRPFIHRRTEVAYPEPTKVFLKLSPETFMLSVPFGCTHRPPPIPPFLFTQVTEPISKGYCRKWHHKMKVSCCLQTVTSGKDTYMASSTANDNWSEQWQPERRQKCLHLHCTIIIWKCQYAMAIMTCSEVRSFMCLSWVPQGLINYKEHIWSVITCTCGCVPPGYTRSLRHSRW